MAEQIVKVKVDLDVTEFNKNAKAMSAALSSVLGRDVEVFNGKIAKTKQLVEQTEKAIGGANNAIKNAGSSIKQSNQQWTNLALVVQDLPYGFRGIQNNLPALMGGIAGLAGPLYLVGSAVIALFTAWDAGMFKSNTATDKLKVKTKQLRDEVIKSTESANEQGIKLKAYIGIANDATQSDLVRNEALKEANKIYGTHNEKLTLANINTERVKKSLDGYIQSLIQLAVAEKYSSQIADNIIEQGLIQADIDEANDRRMKLTAEIRGKQTNESRDLIDVYDDLAEVKDEINKLQDVQNASIKMGTDTTKLYSAALKKSIELSSKFGVVETPKKVKEPKEKKEKQDTFDLIKTTKEFYDAKLNFAENDEVAQKEILLREQQTINELIDGNQMSITDYYNWSSEIYKKLSDLKIKEDRRFFTESERIANQQAKNVETELSIQEKLHKGSLTQRIEDTKVAMAKLAGMAMMSLDPASMAVYLKMFDNLNSKLKGYGSTWEQTTAEINRSIYDFVNNSLVFLGESLGKALAGENVDLFEGLTMLMADALGSLGKALIAYATTTLLALTLLEKPSIPTALAALGAGIAAVAAGSFLKATMSKDKTQKFANGGIISGPTMGLMGEYPGAQNNPEVVAPLDKLKEMIGGGAGNGQFVLRGQDLVLALQRSNSALTLRR